MLLGCVLSLPKGSQSEYCAAGVWDPQSRKQQKLLFSHRHRTRAQIQSLLAQRGALSRSEKKKAGSLGKASKEAEGLQQEGGGSLCGSVRGSECPWKGTEPGRAAAGTALAMAGVEYRKSRMGLHGQREVDRQQISSGRQGLRTLPFITNERGIVRGPKPRHSQDLQCVMGLK